MFPTNLHGKEGVEPLDGLVVLYDAIHTIHEEHDLTKSCGEIQNSPHHMSHYQRKGIK